MFLLRAVRLGWKLAPLILGFVALPNHARANVTTYPFSGIAGCTPPIIEQSPGLMKCAFSKPGFTFSYKGGASALPGLDAAIAVEDFSGTVPVGVNSTVTAAASLVYYITITGPSGGPITLDVTSTRVAEGDAVATFSVNNIAFVAACSGVCPTNTEKSFIDQKLFISVFVGETIPVAVGAEAIALEGIGHSEAESDPYFVIDPSTPNIGLYHLEFSPGIGNVPVPDFNPLLVTVPEPRTWVLMLAGFGLLGLAATRKGKRKTLAA
jgi:hypothetical protein